MSRIRISELVGGSVLEHVRQGGGRIETIRLGDATPRIEAAIMQDVYYVPNALAEGQSVQIVSNR